MINQVVLVGRITEDPTIKENDKGKVSNICIAVPRSFKNSDGIYETDFFPVAIWNSIAENTVEYCRKGDLVGIKGNPQRDETKTSEYLQYLDMEVTEFQTDKNIVTDDFAPVGN